MKDTHHGRTLELLRRGFRLMVSLPRNDADLAKAALDAGADALKVHIGLEHFASGLSTGSLDEEEDALQEIVALGAPVGIVPGIGEGMANYDEMVRLAEIGIDFFDLYATDMPAWMLRMGECPMSVMVAFSEDCWPWGLIEHTLSDSRPDMIEASILPHDRYGEPLTAADISDYAEITHRARQPVVVPTQKNIQPDEVCCLMDAGIAGILIGAIVTGSELDTLAAATKQFRASIDSCYE